MRVGTSGARSARCESIATAPTRPRRKFAEETRWEVWRVVCCITAYGAKGAGRKYAPDLPSAKESFQMMPKFCLVAAVLFGGATVVGVSQADEAATPPAPTASAEVATNSAEIATNQQQTNQGHASGLMVQARVQSQT